MKLLKKEPERCEAAAQHNYTKPVNDCPQCLLVADGKMCPRHQFLLDHGITKVQRKPRVRREA